MAYELGNVLDTLLQGMSQLFCGGLSSVWLFCESYFPYPSKRLLVLRKCYQLMNFVEKNHISYVLLYYLNVGCVLNIEQNVNIILARILVEKNI